MFSFFLSHALNKKLTAAASPITVAKLFFNINFPNLNQMAAALFLANASTSLPEMGLLNR